MKYVAWGTSKLLWIYKTYIDAVDFAYIVETSPKNPEFLGLPVYEPETLKGEKDDVVIVIFAVSNKSINAILKVLAGYGIGLGRGAILYSEIFKDHFVQTVESEFGWSVDHTLYDYASSFTLNSLRPVHTTICGSWLFLESMKHTRFIPGNIAEVGAYQGGNSLCGMLSPVWDTMKTYYIFDSFEGFPDVTENDPSTVGRGTYSIDLTVQEVENSFHHLPQAKVIKGFVPETFSQLPQDEKFSLVFYDCDLYQPALDTYEFCWDRLSPGGVMLIHDYFAEPGGFHGVRKATDKFFANQTDDIIKIPHGTMAALVKK